MKKISFFIFALLFLVVFNAVFWTVGAENKFSVWISYSFIHIAWLANVIVYLHETATVIHDRSKTVYPVYIFSASYLAIELLTGIIFVLIAPDNFLITLIVQLVLFAVYLFCIFKAVGAENKTEQNIVALSMDGEYVRKTSQILKKLCLCSGDTELHDELDRVYNIISSSPIRSNAEARDYEMKVMELSEELDKKIDTLEKEKCLDLIEQIKNYAIGRNSVLS